MGDKMVDYTKNNDPPKSWPEALNYQLIQKFVSQKQKSDIDDDIEKSQGQKDDWQGD